ncbi:MAG: hypothetical protein ACYTG6_14105 [Planctomycetota bacterium]
MATGALRLGAGIVPALGVLAAPGEHGTVLRQRAVRAIARIGGAEGCRALVALAKSEDPGDLRTLFEALAEVGPQCDLEPAYRLFVRNASTRKGRTAHAALRFIAACPPARPSPEVLQRLYTHLDARWAWPGSIAAAIRALLSMMPPSERDLDRIAEALGERRWRHPRSEELGEAMILLEPYREDPAIRDAFEDMIDGGRWRPPEGIRLWARYMVEGNAAAEAIEEEVRARLGRVSPAGLRTRRLLIELLERLGPLDEEAVLLAWADDDAEIRVRALEWAWRALPAERAEAFRCAAMGVDQSLLLAFAAAAHGPAPRRLLETAAAEIVDGDAETRALAARAWLHALEGRDEDLATALESIVAGAGLDLRLQTAARVLERLPSLGDPGGTLQDEE